MAQEDSWDRIIQATCTSLSPSYVSRDILSRHDHLAQTLGTVGGIWLPTTNPLFEYLFEGGDTGSRLGVVELFIWTLHGDGQSQGLRARGGYWSGVRNLSDINLEIRYYTVSDESFDPDLVVEPWPLVTVFLKWDGSTVRVT